MAGIGRQGYPSFGAGEPFKKQLHSKDTNPFLGHWASSAAIWGTRHGVGESLDRYFGLHTSSVSSGFAAQLAGEGIDDFTGKRSRTLGYDQILKLKNSHIKWRALSWKSFKDTVFKNTYEFRQAIKPGQARSFFTEISPKAYAKETLWQGNIHPLKELLSGSRQNLFKNLTYSAGMGLIGYELIKTGFKQYKHWKNKEDGSISSKWHTAYKTGKAVCQKALQSLASWEAAGVGMAIGRALLPIGSIPVGGILVGALFATIAYKAIGKLFPSLAKPGPSES